MIKAQIFPNYPRESGRWSWHIISGNGKIIAYAGEVFANKSNAKRAFDKFMQNIVNLIEHNDEDITIELPVEVLNEEGNIISEY